MSELSQQIKSGLEDVRKAGAFIFDIDNTLVAPDAPFENYPDLLKCFGAASKMGVRLAFVSGSPSAVVANRLCGALHKKKIDPARFTVYANGGSSKFSFSREGELAEVPGYGSGGLIRADFLEKVRELLTDYLLSGFGLDSFLYEKVKEVWLHRRIRQWQGLPIHFDDCWMRGDAWRIGFLDDLKMADVKSNQGAAETTFPFVNIRQARYGSGGSLKTCASFSPTGFYVLSEEAGDSIDLDLRDMIIENLKKDLGDEGKALSSYKAGRSTIDITDKSLTKAAAVKDFISSHNLDSKFVYYLGDEFFEGGNDAILADRDVSGHQPISLISVGSSEPAFEGVSWIGPGPSATLDFLKEIFSS